ncbi:HlyD family efflux transporter periplasmic adaptor subunit [Anaerophilus nitritogenes]|uniref:HlyD family efflux transporter periplasmic adaptor subunit n=1 Tax=Anaerophilus nitritogenes TaxID=2498136 RepID=UPI00101DBE61|nr:HlyD family efflux transporter periplasmic adaptor subunit [Anaerophilus nitritogenes]
MKHVIQDIRELTDSRELLESKPHPFTIIFIYLLISILIIGLTWSYFGEIDVVVKAQGVVRPTKRISTINNMINGKVKEVYIEEGKKVKKGELLYTIDSSELEIQKIFYEKEFNSKNLDIENLKKFKKSILDNNNFFEKDNEKEQNYYNQYLKYKVDSTAIKENINIIVSQIENTESLVKNTEILLSSIKKEKNLFKDEDNEYYRNYLNYMIQLKSLKNILDTNERMYIINETLYENQAVPKIEYDKAKDTFEKNKLDLESFQAKTKADLEINLNNKKQELKELYIQLRKLAPGESATINKYLSIAEKNFKNNTIIEIDSNLQILEAELNQLKSNLESTKLNIEKCIVKAPIDGYINLILAINIGDNLNAPMEIATIIPEDKNTYKMQIYVSNENIGNLKLGDKVKYNFMALPYKEYGELTGKIIKIAEDIKPNKDNNSFYLIEASIENRKLVGYNNQKKEIKVGMVCEARVITKTKKILYYLLEKIDLRI